MAADAPSPKPPTPKTGDAGNALTRKVGPLPVYVWAAAILAIGYLLFFRSSTSSTAAAAPAATDTTGATAVPAASTDASSQGSVDDLLGQLFAQQTALENTLAGRLGGGGGQGSTGVASQGGAPSSDSTSGAASSPAAPTPTVAVDPSTGETQVVGSGVVDLGNGVQDVVTGLSPPVIPGAGLSDQPVQSVPTTAQTAANAMEAAGTTPGVYLGQKVGI